MTIHVVQPGESVWFISRAYGVNYTSILQINGLEPDSTLVPGEALIIPTGERFYPGMEFRLPFRQKNYGYIEVNGYIEPTTGETDARIVNEAGSDLTYISPFSYRVNEDGSLISINDSAILQAARPHRIAPLMVITNFKGGTFDTGLGHSILTDTAVQQTLINNVLGTMKDKGYYGLNIDFERISPDDRELYNSFLRRVVNALSPQNYPVSTALAPKLSAAQAGAWYSAHDYPAHGQIVDFVVLMTYEWGWSGGPPLPVAPINQVKAVLDYAVSVIPPKKIMMGMPLYGYDWILPYRPGGPFAKRVSNPEAIRLAAKYGANVQYDYTAQSPFFNYYDENGVQHIVWFEDARSVQAKLVTASDYGLRGVSYWVLGVPFPQNWAVLDDMFNIVKVVG